MKKSELGGSVPTRSIRGASCRDDKNRRGTLRRAEMADRTKQSSCKQGVTRPYRQRKVQNENSTEIRREREKTRWCCVTDRQCQV